LGRSHRKKSSRIFAGYPKRQKLFHNVRDAMPLLQDRGPHPQAYPYRRPAVLRRRVHAHVPGLAEEDCERNRASQKGGVNPLLSIRQTCVKIDK
jgi:hypothetical protein